MSNNLYLKRVITINPWYIVYWVKFVSSRGIQTPISNPGWYLSSIMIFFSKMFSLVCHRLSQWALMPCGMTRVDIIYIINYSLGRVFIILASVDLNNHSCGFFSWVIITYIWIYFIPLSLDILCIRSDLFLPEVFKPQP